MSLTTSVQYFIRCKTFTLYKKELLKPLYFWLFERLNYFTDGGFVSLWLILNLIPTFLYLFTCQGEVVINCIWATSFRIIDNRSSLVSTYKTTVTTQLCKQKKIRQKIHTKYLVTKICCFSRKSFKIKVFYFRRREVIE